MKTRKIFALGVFCLFVIAAGFAADANVGTWKLNEAKSKIPAGTSKNVTVVYTAAGGEYKSVIDGVDGSGKPTHNEWTGKFDGKDYAIVGDPNADTRAIKKVDEHHYEIKNKKGGKVVITGTIVLSDDGKTRTLTTEGTNAKGEKVSATFVYEKG